jgi:hypothetical protein
LLQSCRQNPLGDDQQPRIARELTLESDLPSDFTPKHPAAFLGDASGDCPCGDAPRLQENDGAAIDERRWNPRGFARARRGRDDDGAAAFEVIANARDVLVDCETRQN